MLVKNLFLSFALTVLFCAAASGSESSDPLKDRYQILLVTTPDWQTVPGTLRRFARPKLNSEWKEVGKPIPIVVGRNGLAWGRGLHPTNNFSGPVKKEGDGKSPAGVFNLSSAFGREPLAKVSFIKLPYQELLPSIECVDDVKSVFYNQIADRDRVSKVDWNSSEKMSEVGAQYRLGVFIDHNTNPTEAGGGSCVFLHIWKNDKTGTAGCTAMEDKNMEELLHWLDSTKHPALVQLPQAEYEKLAGPWKLPKISQHP